MPISARQCRAPSSQAGHSRPNARTLTPVTGCGVVTVRRTSSPGRTAREMAVTVIGASANAADTASAATIARPWCRARLMPRASVARAGGTLAGLPRVAQVVLEQLEDPLVLVGPARGALEAVVLDRIRRQLPVLLAQLDQPLGEPHRILEQHVGVHHAMADEQRPLQPAGKVDGRALAVRLGVLLRHVEDARRVSVVVVGPVGHRAKRRTRSEHVRSREHRHQRDEPAVAPAVDANAPRVDLLLRDDELRAVDDVLEILAAHVAVDRGAPVAPVPGAGAVIDVEYHVAPRGEQVVEHVLAEVARPVLVRVLRVTGAMHEDDAWMRGIAPGADHLRREEAGVDVNAVA